MKSRDNNLTPRSSAYLIVIAVSVILSISVNYAFAKPNIDIPLKEDINIPLTDLSIQKIDVTESFLRLRLKNINSFSKPRIYWAKCGDKYAVISGIQLGKPISTSKKIVISVKKPCNGLNLKLGYRTIRIEFSKNSSDQKTYALDLSSIVDPYLDWTDSDSPYIKFVGNKSERRFIKEGDQFLFHVADNRRLKKILIDGRQVEQDSSGFVKYKLKYEPFIYASIDVSAIDINGNMTEKDFVIYRDYWASFIYYSRDNAGFQWMVGLFGFAFISPFAFGKLKKMQRRKRKREEIDRIRERNEKWHYTREARALKNKYERQRHKSSKLSRQFDKQKKLANRRLQSIKELKRDRERLQKEVKSSQHQTKELNQRISYLNKQNSLLEADNCSI